MNEKKHIILFVVICVISFILGATTIFFIYNRQSKSFREQLISIRTELDTTRENNKRLGIELDNARNTNKELERTINTSKELTRKLRYSIGTNVTTIRECIEIVHNIRIQIEDLQNCLNSVDSNNDCDNNDNLL